MVKDVSERLQSVDKLAYLIETQRANIDRLSPSLLRQAFNAEL
jgi:hypothetical protein